MPELLCLLMFTACSLMWSLSFTEEKTLVKQLNILTRLELSLPQHQVQLLNANFSDQLHYDRFAQLASQIEGTLPQLSDEDELKKLLTRYTQSSQNYIQLVTMLKTSQRLISKKEVISNAKLIELMNVIRIEVFAFITSANSLSKNKIYQLLASEDLADNLTEYDQYWQLYKLHTLFIIDNLEKTTQYRQSLIDLPVIDSTIKSINLKNQAISSSRSLTALSGFGSILAMLLIFMIILKRQQQTLKATSLAYKKAVEVKTQFLANMSHEIRTPMTGIIGLIEICLKTPLSEEQHNYLDKVEFSAKSLLTIINDILDFSKIESGQLHIEKISIKHHKLVDNLNMMLGRTVEEQNIELIFDLDPNIPTSIIGDPVRLNQILLNLLSNGVKFTETGHVILKASIIYDEHHENPNRILYQIVDTGIGLSAEQQAKLFQRFSQADESTTRKYGGTGLGLAISKLLVDLMQGDIWVDSELGKGSTFNVSFPLIEDETCKKAPSIDTHNGLRLLLLEDNKITQQVIEKMALHFHVAIDIASSIKEAKTLCQNNNYDIALVDWNLKGENGVDFIKDIHSKDYCPTSLVICSAYSKAYIEDNSTVSCDLKYLAKPLTFFSFNQALNDHVHPNSEEETQQKSRDKPNKTPINVENAPTDDLQTILLVEDNKINQIVATKLLQSLGLTVDIAQDGVEAIEKIEKGNYFVVLMDIQMPKMDGTEATKVLRETYSHHALKIIALTANITEEEVSFYESIGMDDHLGKPYELDKMVKVLSQYVELPQEPDVN
jgi:signal transduction histidine kinase/DNA-binding response OmpR family regulator